MSALRPRASAALEALDLGLIAAGTVLRFVGLGRQSFWHDEIHSILNSWGPRGEGLAAAVRNPHGPLYLVLLGGWTRAFGIGEGASRALSALLGVLGLLLFRRVARRFASPGQASLALALLAFSPYHLWYSQEARNYVLLVDAGLLSLLAFSADLERPTARTFVAVLATNVIACLANLAGFFLFPLQLAWLALARGTARHPERRWLALAALSALLLGPWIVAGARTTGRPHLRGDDAASDVPIAHGEAPPGPLAVPYTFLDFSVGHTLGPTSDELKLERMRAVRAHAPYLVPIAACFAIAALLGALHARRESRAPLLACVGVPVLVMTAVSVINLKAPNSRYAILAFAPWLLLLAIGVGSLRAPFARVALAFVLLGACVWSDVQFYASPHYWKPDARAAGRLLARAAGPRDAVIVYALDYPVRYYAGDSVVFLAPPAGAFASDTGAAGWLARAGAAAPRVWLVQCQSWWVDREDRLLRAARASLAPAGDWDFAHLPVHRFAPAGGRP